MQLFPSLEKPSMNQPYMPPGRYRRGAHGRQIRSHGLIKEAKDCGVSVMQMNKGSRGGDRRGGRARRSLDLHSLDV